MIEPMIESMNVLGRRIPVLLWILLVFIKQPVLGVKKTSTFGVFEMCWDDGFQFFYWFYWFLLKNLFWGSKKAQHLGFLKWQRRRIPVFLWILMFFIKKPVLGVKKGPTFGVFEMCWDDGFQFFYWCYLFLLKNLFWGSKKAQHLEFLKCAGTTNSSFFMDNTFGMICISIWDDL